MKNRSKLTKSQFEILYGLSKLLTIPEIAKYRKTSRTAVYKLIDTLIQKGFLRKTGRLYELTDNGKKGLHSFMGFRNMYRLHNFSIKIKILNSGKNWEMRKNQITTLKSFVKEWDVKNWKSEIHSIANLKVKTTPQSIIIDIPATYGKSPENALDQAIELFFNAIPKIENLFKITLIKDRKMNMTIISQHYAHLQNALAKKFRTDGKKLYITGDDGKLWLIADYSFQTDELEAIHTIKAQDDIQTVTSFLNDLRKNPTTPSQLLGMIQGVTVNQIIFDKNMQFFNKNLKEHFSVLRGIKREIGNLGKAIKGEAKSSRKQHSLQTSLDKFM